MDSAVIGTKYWRTEKWILKKPKKGLRGFAGMKGESISRMAGMLKLGAVAESR
tara:strand:- start:135 stop:293 length:159 start_codon:yes stop_codon:yes gene_type:complete